MFYLYVKTHNKTGLKYLGKTCSDPFKYSGSGTYWKNHIKKHGYDVTTKVLKECETNNEIKKWGIYYSTLWNVVESKDWANFMPEKGNGMDSESARKIANRRSANGSLPSQIEMKNGTHIFLGEKNPSKIRISNGTHHFLGDRNPIHKLTIEGRNPFSNENVVNIVKERMNAIHSCPYCGTKGKWASLIRRHFERCKNR